MESNKYYTPEIEEFHQGFEYERWHNSAYTPEKYIKEVFEFVDKDDVWNDDITNMLACSYNNGDTLRVKYLDQEDIESLGWKRDKQLYYMNNWILFYDNQNHKLSIIVKDPSLNKEMLVNLKTTEVSYITIKNKSELKKLMKQLNIDGIS